MKVKEFLLNNSNFRITYIITLFFCNIAFIQIPAYAFLVFIFFWGGYLAYRHIRYNHCLESLRFSVWLIVFLAINMLTTLLNLSDTTLYNFIVIIHLGICFFLFFGLHTEKKINVKLELYKICKFIIYTTSILGVLGFIFMMCKVKFVWYWIKFIIYENRFTGVYINPNILGFISVVSLVCCHIVTREDFLIQAKKTRISRIWLALCLTVDLFSLLLCDSNASLVLFICYVIAIIVFNFFSMTVKLSKKQMLMKFLAVVMAGVFVISASFMVRSICQKGFSLLVSSPPLITTPDAEIDQPESFAGEEIITFSHKNSNLDSGRIKLIKESFRLFRLSPMFGISNGNIIHYSQKYLDGYLSMSYHNNDLHNGYLTILVSTGILGFCIFSIFGLRFAKHIAKPLFKRQNALSRDILPCLFAFCCAYLVYSLFEKALLYDISFMVMWFWYMIGQTSVYLNKYEPLIESHYKFSRHLLPRHIF